MKSPLIVSQLTKSFKNFSLGPLEFEIKPGIVVGLIGPNGAGKTTAINIMAGLLRQDGGSVEIAGKVVDQRDPGWKFDLGFAGDDPVFYERWSGEKNLNFLAQFFPDWSDERARQLAKRFDLDLHKKPSELSKGNRAKLYLITVLARQPKLFLFDEPTSGLDPVVRSEVLDVLWEMMESGERSVLYSTHILSDINRIADELIFLIDGKIILRCAKDDLLEKWRRVGFVTSRKDIKLDGVIDHRIEGERHIVIAPDFEGVQRQLSALGIIDLEVSRLTIDEIAVNIMKESNHAANN